MGTCVGRLTAAAAMVTWLIISTFMLISQVESQNLAIKQSPKNVTVSVGESVTLKCVFSRRVDCKWLKDEQPYQIKPVDGNIYTGDSCSGEGTQDCSIKINAVTEDDFTKWRCSSYTHKGFLPVSSEVVWITKRDGTTAKVAKQSVAHGFIAIVSVVVGVTLVITNFILATCVIRLRRQLRQLRNDSTLAMSQSNVTAEGNRYTTYPVSRGAPSTSAGDLGLYEDATSYVRQCSARRDNTDSNGYLEVQSVYAEIISK